MKYKKSYKKYLKIMDEYKGKCSNEEYLSRHPELEILKMPENFYFKFYPDRMEMHYAFIQENENGAVVYFVNYYGRIFDKLEFKNKKLAKRRLRKRKFYFTTNVYCHTRPDNPIYIKLSTGRKSAPYSKGSLWSDEKYVKKIKEQENIEEVKISFIDSIKDFLIYLLLTILGVLFGILIGIIRLHIAWKYNI